MMIRAFSLSLALVFSSALAQPEKWAAKDRLRGIEGVEAIDKELKQFTSLSQGAPKVLRYYKKGARFPSCGLVSTAGEKNTLLPILEVDAGEQFPNCNSVDDAAAFTYENKSMLVYQYTTQETRNNTEIQYFFATIGSNGFASSLDELNSDNPPAGKSIRWITTWALMKLHRKSLQDTSFVFQEKDSILSNNGLFALDFDKTNKICTVFAIPSHPGAAAIKFQTQCESPVATSSLRKNDKEFFLVITAIASEKYKAYIFSIENGVAAIETDVLSRIAGSASSGKVIQLKAQLRKELGI